MARPPKINLSCIHSDQDAVTCRTKNFLVLHYFHIAKLDALSYEDWVFFGITVGILRFYFSQYIADFIQSRKLDLAK